MIFADVVAIMLVINFAVLIFSSLRLNKLVKIIGEQRRVIDELSNALSNLLSKALGP